MSTGAEAGSGTGRSYYATPWDLRFRPWALDFTPDDAGTPAYPFKEVTNPYHTDDFLEWTTDDWDPALRFWTLPFDRQLNEWLKSVDQSRTYIMAGREFGAHKKALWRFERKELLDYGWLEQLDLAWEPDPALRAAGGAPWTYAKTASWNTVRAEIEELQQLMQDDRDRYLAEIELQADNGPDYIVAFIGASIARFPWTIELINCGLSIGNIASSYYKAMFKRVRPSFLCPGLAPPFGPPAHPSFPSGHSFLGHLMALLLLEIPWISRRYGMFYPPYDGSPGKPVEPYPRVSISASSPAVISLRSPGLTAHGLNPDEKISFREGGTLPSSITPNTPYYVLTSGMKADSFEISDSIGGTAINAGGTGPYSATIDRNPLIGRGEIDSPLLWLSQRLAKNRERLGVHYISDSMASRHLAAALWRALLHEADSEERIVCPTLKSVLDHARAEWPTT